MKKFLAIMLSLAMLLSLTACGVGEGGPGKLNFTTGGDQGTYYGFGTVLAGVISDKTKTQVTAITSGGSKANIEAMQAGDAQVGFVQSDVGAYAFEGIRLFEEGGKVDNFSTICNLSCVGIA